MLLHLVGPAFQESANAVLGFGRALRDGGHQRFGQEALVGRLLGDAGQGVHQRVIGQRRVFGDALGQLERLVESGARRHQVLRHADALAVLRIVDAAGEHHVRHARGADQARDAHRTATAHENAARTFGQRVERARVRDADVAGRGEFEPAADHGAVQCRDDRHGAVLQLFQRGVPHAGMQQPRAGVALFQLGQVEAGAEVFAIAVEHGGAYALRQRFEGSAHSLHQRIAQRVALGGPVQAHDGDVAIDLELDVFLGQGNAFAAIAEWRDYLL